MAETFDVIGQQEVLDLGAETGPVPAIEVTFKTKPHNIVGTVRIPKKIYTPEEVQKEVLDLAQRLEATHTL